MQRLTKLAAAFGVAAAVALSAIPANAIEVWVGHRHHHYGGPHYYNSYRGGGLRTWNGCPPDWTIQGGVCKPYRHGPWDWY
jgi:hypothetical protein